MSTNLGMFGMFSLERNMQDFRMLAKMWCVQVQAWLRNDVRVTTLAVALLSISTASANPSLQAVLPAPPAHNTSLA